MPIRTPPSLSEILAQFQAVQQKSAEEGSTDPPETVSSPPDTFDAKPADSSPGGQLGTAADDLIQAARKLEQADSDKGKAADEVVDAADALKEIALNAADGQAEALAKEAQVFGKIFAESVVSELHKTAADDGGNAMRDGPMSEALLQVKLGEVYDEAYALALSKIAENSAYAEALRQLGYDPADPAVVAVLAGAQEEEDDGQAPNALYPQSLAAAVSPPSAGQPADSSSAALLQAGNATREVAEAARAAAEAASLLVANVQDRNVNLPDLTRNAYAQTVERLQDQA